MRSSLLLLLCSSCVISRCEGPRCEVNTPDRCEGGDLLICKEGFVLIQECDTRCDTENNTCQQCGDGILSVGESCDDGNNNNNDDCNNDCELTCGASLGADGVAQDAESGHCYVGFREPLNWFQAEAHCEELGGYLVVIDSIEENLLARTVSSPLIDDWIGITDADTEGTFIGVNGENIAPFDSFVSPEPNGGPDENCVHFTGALSWNDFPCQNIPPTPGYICEIEPEHCGDGVTQVVFGEECDDRNVVSGDGCSTFCQSEVACGDGIINDSFGSPFFVEQCDDGNFISGDGCNAFCQTERCGNARIDPGEECDDGNLINSDGCSHDCRLPFCGNGFLDPGEECEDSNNLSGDGCSADCVDEAPNNNCNNLIIEAGELCPFGIPVLLEIGPRPSAIRVADVDLDGLPDLAITNQGKQNPNGVSGSIMTFIQGDDGAFLLRSTLPAGAEAKGLVFVDLNNDDLPDLSWNQHRSGQPGLVQVFATDGEGVFLPAQEGHLAEFTVGVEPTAIVSADFDSDGRVDVATVAGVLPQPTQLFIFLANGAVLAPLGSFGGNTFGLVAGDLNHDGLIDIVSAGDGPQGINIFLNGNGDIPGSFAAPSSLAHIGSGSQEAFLVRFDAGPTLDLLVRNLRAGPDDISLYLGNGDGTFQAGFSLPIDEAVDSLQVSDLNQDGRVDLITEHSTSPSQHFIAVRLAPDLNTIALEFSDPGCSGLQIADINLDGVLDLAMKCGDLPTGQAALYFGTR